MAPVFCLTSEELLAKAVFANKNAFMLYHLAEPYKEGDAIMYQTNPKRRPHTLIHFQNKRRIRNCTNKYPCRMGKCFPGAAPICCPPMRYRPAQSLPPEPAAKKVSSRAELYKVYTRKLKIRPKED